MVDGFGVVHVWMPMELSIAAPPKPHPAVAIRYIHFAPLPSVPGMQGVVDSSSYNSKPAVYGARSSHGQGMGPAIYGANCPSEWVSTPTIYTGPGQNPD